MKSLLQRGVAALLAVAVASPTALAQVPGGDTPARGPGLGVQPDRRPTEDARPQDDEMDVLRDVEDEWSRYVGAANDHHRRLRGEMLGELDRRVAQLEKKFAEQIAKAQADKSRFRGATKELLLKFIAEHPNHPQFTPDARYRLADIYLFEADEAVDAIEDMTAVVTADYSLAIEQWEIILRDFPEYRQLPSVVYQLAYYLKAQGTDERRALLLFLALTCSNRYKWSDPPPAAPTKQEALARIEDKTYRDPYADCVPMKDAELELLQHAWVRGIADYQFNVPGELDGAISGYMQVTEKAKDSSLYAESLYKLAWSLYKKDQLLESIKKFDESVVLYDKTIAAGQQPPLDLRDESLQYIAVAFTDPWAGETDTDPVKAFQRAEDFYKGRESEPHVRDVWVALGRAFLELQAYDQAVDSFRIAIGPPWELDPDNPVVHQEIVDAYELAGDKIAADAAAAELATRYAEGTPWYIANEKNREAMENQRRIAERALYASALNTHSAATAKRLEYEAGGRKEQALWDEAYALYDRAIGLYEVFIKQYPESDYVYQFTFMMGEAYFFSGRYMEAVPHYKWVRDHRELSEQFFVKAANSVIASYEQHRDWLIAQGQLPAIKAPTLEELKAMPQPLSPQPIPPFYQELMAEWSYYQEIAPDPKTAPVQGMNAGLLAMMYLHLDDAQARFYKVMTQFCGTADSARAKDYIVVIYDATGQLEKIRTINEEFLKLNCGDEAARKEADLQIFGLQFRVATELLEKGQYLEAATEFYTYYKTAKVDDPDRATALYNTAVAYKLAARPKTAVALLKEFTESTDKVFRESPYYLEAMRATAISYQSAYDYKNAFTSYLALYELAKQAKAKGIKLPPAAPGEAPPNATQIALEALYNAAVVAELDRDFTKALTYYKKYDAEEPDRARSSDAVWAQARIHRQSGDVDKLSATMKSWRTGYGGDKGNEDRYVESFYAVAKLYQRKGKTKDSDTWGKSTIKAWKDAGSIRRSAGGRMAAEYELMFAERQFTTFEKFVLKQPKDDKELVKNKNALTDLTAKTADLYSPLEAYGWLEYTLAFYVRFGDLQAGYAEKLLAMPPPRELEKIAAKRPELDLIAKYEQALQTEIEKNGYLTKAKKYWMDAVDAAKQAGIANEWSQRAIENLERDFPDEFDALHQDLYEGTDRP